MEEPKELHIEQPHHLLLLVNFLKISFLNLKKLRQPFTFLFTAQFEVNSYVQEDLKNHHLQS
jgi:hypothetical protein